MYVWEHRNRRHRRLSRKPPRPRANASIYSTREEYEHELELQGEEVQRQELEDLEVDIKKEEIRLLVLDYLADEGGKQELGEVTENLKHWKENCIALGYDSDGEILSVSAMTGTSDESTKRQRQAEEREARSRRKNAREVFDMFDADGSHTISTSEMQELLAEMCIPLDKLQLKTLMKEIDTDGSGEVDFEEFYNWYRDNAAAVRNAEKTQTVSLFATKLVKGLTGFTLRMEARRIIMAHAQAQVEKRERDRFRLHRPPRFVCDDCGQTFASRSKEKRHFGRREVRHEARDTAESEADRRFHPVSVLLDHTTPPPVEGVSLEPHRAIDSSTARKKRLRRLMFSDTFYLLYGGVSSIGVQNLEEKPWVNRPHPRLEDLEDRRGGQLRRGQSVEGENPVNDRAKVALEVTRGGLTPSWGGVRRSRQTKIVADRQVTGFQHILLRLNQEKAQAHNVFTADESFARAKVVLRWDGWASQQVTLHTEFNAFKPEGMGEDQSAENPGHETVTFLSPGTYKYYFTVDGRRRVDDSLPVVGNDADGWYNVVTVTNEHLGKEGQLAATEGGDGTKTPPRVRRLRREFLLSPKSHHGRSTSTADYAFPDSPSRHRQGDIFMTSTLPVLDTGDAEKTGDEAMRGAGSGHHQLTEERESLACCDSSHATNSWASAPLTRIDLSRHQINDDGAAGLAMALAGNVRVKELDLSFNRISGHGAAALAFPLGDPRCSITQLRLAQNGIGKRGSEHLGRMLGGGGVQLTNVPCLRELNLADNMLGDDGVEALSVGLKGHPCLERLILDGNDIGYDGTRSLNDALLQNATMKYLSLRRNVLLPNASQVLSELLLRNRTIENLDVAYNPLGAEGVRKLVPFLHINTTLDTLVLRGCGVQPPRVKSGVYSLARALATNQAVTSLDLAANELDEYAGQELAHALLKNKTITEMDFTGNDIPGEWLREHHRVCSEVYGILPSLAESLRLNRDWKVCASFVSPRSVQREKKRIKENRALERRERLRRGRQPRDRGKDRKIGGEGGGRGLDLGRSAPETANDGVNTTVISISGKERDVSKDVGRARARAGKKEDPKRVTLGGGDSGSVGGDVTPLALPSSDSASDPVLVPSPHSVRSADAVDSGPTSALPEMRRYEASEKVATKRLRGAHAYSSLSKEPRVKRFKEKNNQADPHERSSKCSSSAGIGRSTAAAPGIPRVCGVWTRRGVWVPDKALTTDGVDLAREKGRRMGDRQRQRREDEEVQRAGDAKREVLMEFLQMPEGEILVANVAKLLLYARREKAKEERNAERALRAEIRASNKANLRLLKARGSPGNGVIDHTTKHAGLGTLWTARTPSYTVPLPPWSSTYGRTWGGTKTAVGPLESATAAEDELEMLDASTVGSHATMLSSTKTVDTATSSLPSMVAAALMEAEGEEEIKRLVGSLREEKKAWEATHRPRFLEVFSQFDPEGFGEMCASEIGGLLLQLQVPEFLRPAEVKDITNALMEETEVAKADERKAAAKAARRAGLERAPEALRPFTTGGRGSRPVAMLVLWRWYARTQHHQPTGNRRVTRSETRKLKAELRHREKNGEFSRGWARRVILTVGEREARLQAAERFRDANRPRFICHECHEFGCSSADSLDYHLLETSWHAVHTSLQEIFEEHADLVAVARRAMGGDSFPDFFEVARSLPKETEIQVHQEATELSRPLGTIKYDMLVVALQEEGDWLKINFESHRGVYAKHMVLPKNVSFWGARSPQCILTRMRLPAARASAKAAASSAHLSSTTASTALMRPLTLAALGVQGLSHTATRALHAAALTLIHRQPYIPETDALAAGTAVFKPRVVRFVVPVVYCHVKGLPPGVMLKVRTNPRGGDDARGGGRVLGRIGREQCIVGLATSGDWLQVRYGQYEAAWTLLRYKGQTLLAPLSDLYSGVDVEALGEGGDGGGDDRAIIKMGEMRRESPFPMHREVLERSNEKMN